MRRLDVERRLDVRAEVVVEVAVLEDEEQVVGRDRLRRARARHGRRVARRHAVRVDRDQRVAGLGANLVIAAWRSAAVHSVKPIVWPVPSKPWPVML